MITQREIPLNETKIKVHVFKYVASAEHEINIMVRETYSVFSNISVFELLNVFDILDFCEKHGENMQYIMHSINKKVKNSTYETDN